MMKKGITATRPSRTVRAALLELGVEPPAVVVCVLVIDAVEDRLDEEAEPFKRIALRWEGSYAGVGNDKVCLIASDLLGIPLRFLNCWRWRWLPRRPQGHKYCSQRTR